MIRCLVRTLGILVLALGLVVLNYDVTKTLDAHALHVTKSGDLWHAVHSTSLQLLQAGIERHVAEWLWDPVLLNILTAPACVVLGVIGLILVLLGRRKAPTAD